ncbi:MAG: chromosome segregation protein SMC [Sulfuriferula sp.]|nr:chromosome segregation protein SMC [Sulfuriferula sp.]
MIIAQLRLTAIKLAGFKSFVDPTHIPIVGQMVGVVGPNGCGKSNVIDAVRWVLGESQAKQLRGASMADVIFNGSTTRKPVSRASVELTFDNSDGKAPGQWAQYAEVSVKRVLTRNGESSYYINNMHVRRRDLVDIFLGTGLGTKTSYAIIEQGMISRIIEAKPEELRGFLEEAAGISKYKERRRETEARLNDTRENLIRLEDIRCELGEQIERLRGQAEVALEYQTLQDELKAAQQLLWFVKKRDAETGRLRYHAQIQQTQQQLTEQVDALRGIEHELESSRHAHQQANTGLNDAQGEFYSAVAEVSKLEQAVRHLADTRARLHAQAEQLGAQQESLLRQHHDLQTSLAEWQQREEDTGLNLEEATLALEAATEVLPEIEAVLHTTQQRTTELQRESAAAEQVRQVNETHLQHAAKTLQQLEIRQTRLQHEQGSLPSADQSAVEHAERVLNDMAALRDELAEQFEVVQHTLATLEGQQQPLRAQLEQHTRSLHQVEGELAGLTKVQQHLTEKVSSDAWLARHKLTSLPRLWQQVDVADGWETAFEAVLGARMQAIAAGAVAPDFDDVPADGLSIFDEAAPQAELTACKLTRLLDKVCIKAGEGGALQDWLSHVFIADNAAQASLLQSELPLGAQIVCAEGHIFSRHSVHYHAKSSNAQGVLARQKEIERLAASVEIIHEQKSIASAQLSNIEAEISSNQQDLGALRSQLQHTQQQFHQRQLESVKLQQAHERTLQRRAQITAELAEIEALMAAERGEQANAELQLQQYREQAAQLREHLDDARRARQDAEGLFNQKREQQRQLERKLQEIRFSVQFANTKINDLNNAIKVNDEQRQRLAEQREDVLGEAMALDEAAQTGALQDAVTLRQHAEQNLALAREQLEVVGTQLRRQEESRMTLEHALAPLREQLENLRLKHQEAELQEQQCEEQLQMLNADQDALAEKLTKGAKSTGLTNDINRLTMAIDALGAVNLAAMQELEHAAERETYLQDQTSDLEQAMATLTEVIATIDGETRDLLKTTFDTVNQSMSELFTTLFGGGRAELILTGDELLDAGIQVFAQPPGKKNSSIHLLSGGEKALTALSLVFALFKLTPAPFCLLDEVDAPLDDTNTERYARLVKQMSSQVQFLYITHNRITMEAAEQLIGVTMQESGVSRTVSVDIEQATRLAEV